MLSYIRILWLHSSSQYPIDLWSELNTSREELRKVEIWADGRIGYASCEMEAGGTRIGEIAVPSLDEINASPEFQAEAITKADFEICWAKAVSQD